MPNVEKMSIALPAEMALTVRRAVKNGQYASSSEVVREALRDWSSNQSRREKTILRMRALVREAIDDPRPMLTERQMEKVFDRLEKKYEKMAAARGKRAVRVKA